MKLGGFYRYNPRKMSWSNDSKPKRSYKRKSTKSYKPKNYKRKNYSSSYISTYPTSSGHSSLEARKTTLEEIEKKKNEVRIDTTAFYFLLSVVILIPVGMFIAYYAKLDVNGGFMETLFKWVLPISILAYSCNSSRKINKKELKRLENKYKIENPILSELKQLWVDNANPQEETKLDKALDAEDID